MVGKVREIFRGRVVTLNVETVTLPNGVTDDLEIVHHPGGAAAVAVNDQFQVCLLHQYRHASGGWLWELPAGKRDRDEDPLALARRELEEEAGLRAASWRSLGTVVSSPGVFTEVLHLYLATQLTSGTARPEAAEVFRIEWVPLAVAVQRALHGDIIDSKTVIGLLRATHALGR
jgi:ADP-ribose pyrophosphatase